MTYKKRLLSTFALLAIAVAGMSAPAQAQLRSKELQGLLGRVAGVCAKLDEAGYTVAHIEADKLRPDQRYKQRRKLFRENTYMIVGVGGPGVSDLDMRVIDSRDRVVGQDRQRDNVPIVEFRPSADGTYHVESDIYSLQTGKRADGEYYFVYIVAWKRATLTTTSF